MNINFIFFSISNNFETFHRKREIEAIVNDKKRNVRAIYFTSAQFIIRRLFSRGAKKPESFYTNITICNLFILLPMSWALKSRLLMYLFVTIPIKLQTIYFKKRYLNPGSCISWFYKPDQYLYLKSLTPYIYLHYDNYQGDKTYQFSGNKRFNTVLNKCISNSLLTLVSSSKLFEKYKVISPSKVFYYPNAIARSLISDKPSVFNGSKEQVIGFIGQLDHTFDSVLLEKIAYQFNDYKIKLIGPIKNKRVTAISEKYDNIELLGYLDYEKLSEEIKLFTIGICPYAETDFNQYRNPLKISEYFSYGIPVVSVKCDIDKKAEALVAIASNHDEFVELLAIELANDSLDKVEKRINFAKNNCWDNRVFFIMSEIDKLRSSGLLTI